MMKNSLEGPSLIQGPSLSMRGFFNRFWKGSFKEANKLLPES